MTESQTASPMDLSRVPIQDRSVPASTRQDFRALVRTMDIDQARLLVAYCRSMYSGTYMVAELAGLNVDRTLTHTPWQYQAYAAYWQALVERIAERMNPRAG